VETAFITLYRNSFAHGMYFSPPASAEGSLLRKTSNVWPSADGPVAHA
jgi:hypothetical protein